MKKLRIVLIVLLACVFAFSLYKLVDKLLEYRKADKIYDSAREQFITTLTPPPTAEPSGEPKPAEPGASASPTPSPEPQDIQIGVNFEKLKQVAPDAVGWILIPDTDISFPLVQTDNNYYYLYRAYDDTPSNSGSIYLDYRSLGDFSSAHTIIYGHNMLNGGMFHPLSKFRDAQYITEHPSIYVFTPDGKRLVYDIFSVYVTTAEHDTYRVDITEQNLSEFYHLVRGYNEYMSDQPDIAGNILTLSTCVTDKSKRMIIHAALRPAEEPEQS